MMHIARSMLGTALTLATFLIATRGASADEAPQLREIEITSSLDGTVQKAMFWAPEAAQHESTPLFVFLHSWSSDYRQKNTPWRDEAFRRGWIVLQPDFRGPNLRPEACGSKLARQDVLDAIEYVIANYKVDTSRLYLAGSSGGGHMAMLMAGYYPERFSAVTAWVGISDLAEWYRFHTRNGTPSNYAKMIAASCGGAPGDSPAVDAEYRARSPIPHLPRAAGVPMDLNAGVHDGHTGSVPISHTLRAFNVLAKANGGTAIADDEIEQLTKHRRLEAPRPEDTAVDESYGRALYLRRTAAPARVTIFEGGHESIAAAGCAWLETQKRPTRSVRVMKSETGVESPPSRSE